MILPKSIIYVSNDKISCLDISRCEEGSAEEHLIVIGNKVWIGGYVIILLGVKNGYLASHMTINRKENSMKNQVIVGHIGLVQRSKKQRFTIELLKELRSEGYDAIGVFAGECREPEYMIELNQKVEQYDLREHVTFLGRRNDIPDWLKIIDILIIPSTEGFPLAGLEAAAAGVPVIGCDAAGAEEFIRVSGDGVTYTEDDVDSAADAVGKILAGKEKYKKAGIEFASQMSNHEYSTKAEKIFKSIE